MGGAVLLAAMSMVTATSAQVSPVERVVRLLEDLKEKLSRDEKQEQQAYDKYACWCVKTTARKAAAITDAQDDLRALGQAILSLKGRVATLTSEIDELNAGIKENQKVQATLTSIRQKENSAFMTETAEMKQALVALQEAITVLVNATMPSVSSTAFLQSSERAGTAVRA